MSRRRERAAAERQQPAERQAESARGEAPPGRAPDKLSFLAQVAILVAVFAGTSLIALALGAANLGTAFGIGEFFFAIVLVLLMVKT
jgi:hypothetical protein